MLTSQSIAGWKIGGDTSIANLRAALHGKLILPGEADYETARQVWNGAIDRHPALIIRCADATDVRRAVEFGRQTHLDIAVRGGGHSFPGHSTCEGGLVIDLSPMKAVVVNAQEQTARAQPGVNLGELIQATQAYGLGTNTGTASDTGIAGLTLGGGIGWLMGKYGLSCDNVRSFDVVTADGRLVRANTQENPDLYWGLRGGGGNFGIVTAFEYQLHPLGTILGGMVVHPLSRARAVLEFYRDFTHNLPDELVLACAMLMGLDGKPVIGMFACWCGDLSEGERVIAPLRKFGPPLVDRIQPMPYAGLFALIDPATPAGRGYHSAGGGIKVLSDAAIDALVDAAQGSTSPYWQINLMPFHGAAARVGESETAFAFREEHYEVQLFAAWDKGGADQPLETGEKHVQWVRQSWQALQPFASRRTYVNFLGDEGAARIRAAYGPNYERLVALKTKYDPDNLFHLNQNIKPNSYPRDTSGYISGLKGDNP
jgi:FAD/FMN-containing dehydrogenase